MKTILIISTVILHNQLATSQVFRPQYTRPIAELENGKFINLPPNVITDPPSTNIIPVPKIIPAPRTTLITDCSPSICENLANTIQLMIVCNLLQNKYSSECINNKLTLPVLNDLAALNNVIMPKIVNSNIPQSNIVGNYIPSNFYPSVPSLNPHNMILPNVIPPNVIPPNMIPSNMITPNLITPNVITPNMITPNMITPGVIPPPVIPTAVSPACPNAQLGTANVNALLNTLMGMLGNIRANTRKHNTNLPLPMSMSPKTPIRLATPFPAIVETIDNIPNPQCCCCKDQLILPPLAVELPRSLGYFQSALPLVAKYFSPSMDNVMTGAYLPVAACDLVIAAPVCPEYAPLVKPIVL